MKFLRTVLFIVAAVWIASSLTNRSDTVDGNDFNDYLEMVETCEEQGTYYQQLTDYQKAIYNALLPEVAKAEEQISLTNLSPAEFKENCYQASIAIQYDHPEYFWFTGGYEFTSYSSMSGKGSVELEPYYYEYVSSFFPYEEKQAQLTAAVKNVAARARSHSADPYEQMIFVHDYLIENAYYDHDRLDEYYKTYHNPSCEYIFSAYGCLVEGRTVCSGYAKAYLLILQELGYDCSYVVGDAGGPHGWNCVYIEGEGYYVDVTWDNNDYHVEVPSYEYAFINDEALSRTHTVDMEFETPECTATEYNYYIKRNYYTETYDLEAVAKILTAQAEENAATVMFGSAKEMNRAYENLVENGGLRNIDTMDDFRYAIGNKNHYTLTVFKETVFNVK